MKKICLFLFCIFSFSTIAFSQVGINTVSPASNTDLTLGSTDKGFLPNKVALVSSTSIAPLTGTVAEGTIVYNTTNNGSLGAGLFYWSGSQWIRFTTTTAKQQDSQTLNYVQTGTTAGNGTDGDEIIAPYLTSEQVTAGGVGTLIPKLTSSFSVSRNGTVFVLAVLYAKLRITTGGNINYSYVSNTFFRVRVTKSSDSSIVGEFIAGTSAVSTPQPGTSSTVAANNNPAVAVAQGTISVEANVNYDVNVYALEGWVTSTQGVVTVGTYMWGANNAYKLFSSLKIDYVSVPY